MLQIYLARHGEDADSAAGILNGHRDQPLTDAGETEAQELTRTIWSHGLHFDAVYCSPLKRAYRAAEVVTDTLELPKPVTRPALIERDFGVMTGAREADIEDLCGPDIIKSRTSTYFLHPQGAETFPELVVRARAFLGIIKSDHTDGNVLIMTHSDICKLLFAAYYDLEWQPVISMFHFESTQLIKLAEDETPATALLSRK
jgi:broad specificity phosphatase PhoE